MVEGEAKFGELAFQFLQPVVEIRVAERAVLREDSDKFDEAVRLVMMGVIGHGRISFQVMGRESARPGWGLLFLF
jgi:hypothetical protein